MIRRAIAATCGLLVCVLVAGCGGGHHSPPQHAATAAGTPATDAQVLMLARVLQSNLEHGGAQFTAALQVNGQPAVATGQVDFRSGRGTALVRPAQAGLGPPRRFFWTRRTVLAQAAPGSRRYARQVPNEQGNPVHAMIGFINLLSAETIDNTTAIESQSPRLLGKTMIGGTPVDEFSYGRTESIKLWILRNSGLLRRISTVKVPGGITVDLVTHQPITIHIPSTTRG